MCCFHMCAWSCRVKGNEIADSLASIGVVAGSKALNHADVLNTGRTGNSGSKLDSTFLAQLLELGVILGVARNTCHTGNRRLINQHRIRTISCHVLTEILRMRFEHLWASFMCSEDY